MRSIQWKLSTIIIRRISIWRKIHNIHRSSTLSSTVIFIKGWLCHRSTTSHLPIKVKAKGNLVHFRRTTILISLNPKTQERSSLGMTWALMKISPVLQVTIKGLRLSQKIPLKQNRKNTVRQFQARLRASPPVTWTIFLVTILSSPRRQLRKQNHPKSHFRHSTSKANRHKAPNLPILSLKPNNNRVKIQASTISLISSQMSTKNQQAMNLLKRTVIHQKTHKLLEKLPKTSKTIFSKTFLSSKSNHTPRREYHPRRTSKTIATVKSPTNKRSKTFWTG